MKFLEYSESDRQEIEVLFTRTFSDPEGESEGKLIGHLVQELMNSTETDDMCGFIITEQEQIVGCIFFTRLSFDSPVKAFMLKVGFEHVPPELCLSPQKKFTGHLRRLNCWPHGGDLRFFQIRSKLMSSTKGRPRK